MKDLCKLFVKKLTRDKFLIFKVVIYSAYMVLSCKKAAACYRLLLDQLRSSSMTVVSNAAGTLWNLSARSVTDQTTLIQLGAR